MRVVLASTSPRRKELLALLGVPFDVCPPTFLEQPIPGLSPREQVARFALEKARSVACLRPEDIVLGSDTVIESHGRACEVGRFLTEEERLGLAGRLRQLVGRSSESPALDARSS